MITDNGEFHSTSTKRYAARQDGPRINKEIQTATVRCIDPEGEQMGILTIDDALRKADEFGLDLVELQPNAEPPVVKILDYGKYKYQAQKRASEARKKQKVSKSKRSSCVQISTVMIMT